MKIILVDAALYIIVLFKYNISFMSAMHCLLISLLTTISLYDLKYEIIPDKLNAVVTLTGICLIIYDNSIIYDKLAGFFIGLGMFFLIAYVTDAMGGGDIKLMAALGLVFGIRGILFIALCSFVIGALVSIVLLSLKIKSRKDNIPFAPFISCAALLYILCGEELLVWYLSAVTI